MLSISEPNHHVVLNSDTITYSDQVNFEQSNERDSPAPQARKISEVVSLLLKSDISGTLKTFYEFPAKKTIKIVELRQFHYFHPSIVRVLNEYHNGPQARSDLAMNICIAYIVEGSQEDANSLKRTISSMLHLNDDSLQLSVGAFLNSSCERISYGHKQLRELNVWENRNLDCFDESFKEYIVGIRRHRLLGKITLLQALDAIFDDNKPDQELMIVEQRAREEPVMNTENTEPAPQQSAKKARIIDYFQVLPKEAPVVVSNDFFFMPFQVKPNTRIHIHARNLRRHSAGYVAKCWNDIDAHSVLKLKLLQFGEDYRPAYFGTWSKKSKLVGGRRPFVKDTEQLNYEYESEEEWQDENNEDGESILGSESESEGEEEEVLNSEDSWVVPDGYLSDGEGVGVDDLPKELDPFYDPGLASRKASGKQRKMIRDLRISISGPHFLPLISHTQLDPWERLEAVFCP